MDNCTTKKKAIKWLLVFLALVATLFFFPSNALAHEKAEIQLTDSLAMQIAQEFADSINGEPDVKAANPTKIYDENGQAIGYIVPFKNDDGLPNGYVTLDNSDPSLFAEWTFEAGSTSPIAQLDSHAATIDTLNDAQSKIVVKTAPFTYAAAYLQAN